MEAGRQVRRPPGAEGRHHGRGQDDNHRGGKGKWDSWGLWMREVKERGESSMIP